MRLDKFISGLGTLSRKEAAKAAKAGLITVNGKAVRDVSMHIDENADTVTYCGKALIYEKYIYAMLNKPSGYISTSDGDPRSVMRLLPEKYSKLECFPCGRLDVDTVGLLLITNDGPLAHELLSPRHHVEKTYYFKCDPPIGEEECEKLRCGVNIGDIVTKPARITSENGEGEISITEGKFHQIKRMLNAVGSNITYLKRTKFASLTLDDTLPEGKWRELKAEEILYLKKWAEK